MTAELFREVQSIAPDIVLARKRLLDAERKLDYANTLMHEYGPEAQPVFDVAESEYIIAFTALKLVEREAMARIMEGRTP